MTTRSKARGDKPEARIDGVTLMDVDETREVSERFIERLRDAGMSEENLARVSRKPQRQSRTHRRR